MTDLCPQARAYARCLDYWLLRLLEVREATRSGKLWRLYADSV